MLAFLLNSVTVIWSVFARMAPWLLLGFGIAGVLAVWIPRHFVLRYLGSSSGFKGILRAVIIGIPLPICSCGVIPIATGLRTQGAGKGPTAAFLISTPQTGVDSILATYALMGPLFAFTRPIAALVTGLVGGAVVNQLASSDSSSPHPTQPISQAHTLMPSSRGIKAILWQGYVRLLGSVVKPLIMGLLIAAVVTLAVPDDFFVSVLKGHDLLAMPLMVLIGFPMYICSTAAIPIAVSLIEKGLSPGAAFVFLMVGPAINALSITTVSSMIGRKATLGYVLVIALGAILCGIGVNLLSNYLPLNLLTNTSQYSTHLRVFQQICGIILVSLMLFAKKILKA